MLAPKPSVAIGAHQRESRLQTFSHVLHTRMSSDPSQRNAKKRVCCCLQWRRPFFFSRNIQLMLSPIQILEEL